MSFSQHHMEPKGHRMRTKHHSCPLEEATPQTEIIQASNVNLIISVIETTQKGYKLNDVHQRLLTTLSEMTDSRGTWVISFSTKEEACEFEEVMQSSFNPNEKPIYYFEETFGAGFLGQDHDTKKGKKKKREHSTKHSYLRVGGFESFDCKLRNPDYFGCVVIVVGVDVSVLKKAIFAVTHKIPVVFIQGSGSEDDLKAACRNENERWTDNDKDECEHLLTDILKETKYVNICSQSETTDLQYAILLALKKAHQSTCKTCTTKLLLSLAWRWNKFDFAQNEIQFPDPMSACDETESLTRLTNVIIADTLFETLANDQADFVELLFRTELKVTIEVLQKLYSDVLGDNAVSSTMTMFIQNQLQQNQSRKSSEFPLMLTVGKLLNAKLNKMCNPYNDTERPIGFVDLFLFAILFNRQRLGELMWRHCQDKLGTALVACSILKAFANTAGCYLESELSTDLLNHARDYERKAIGVLTECYKKDKKKAHDILIKTLEKPFDKIRPLELANRFQLEEFMGHDCCQTKLNIIWRGKITGHMRWWKILLALFMPLFIFWIKFTTNEPVCCKEPNKRIEQEPTKNGPEQEPSMKEHKQEPERRTKTYKLSKPQFYSVSIRRNNHHGNIHIIDAIYYLYTAPFSVYTFNMVSYVIFLVNFSYFIIVDLNEATSLNEYIIWGWALTMFFEELRECFFFMVNKTPSSDPIPVRDNIRGWLGSHWNKFDLLIYGAFIATIALRYTLSGDDFQYVRFIYSVTAGLYSMRFLQIFLVAENIGPKLIMIRKMVADLTYFVGIFAVFFASFSVMYQANMYPNSQPSPFLWDKFFHTPFWQIYGELFLNDFIPGYQNEDCDRNATSADLRGRCPEANRLVIFIAGIYITFTHILLMNLLIAIFSHTFASVQEKSGQIWKYYWYGIVLEYCNRTVFCPPLIILGQIYRSFRFVVALGGGFEYYSEFRLNDEEGSYSKHLLKFADAAAKRYLQQNKAAKTQEFEITKSREGS
ncbi:hypothetical protein DPMN_194911 [Dreissena polymorpha]|uniref:Uncharacterized protein n=1 Tax=Dreissena polymorpha TaxID=45954 RepID=A0A9D3Y530_DREPO|nr:hypothetical protein DPMN_194911 [Dreissena polymorpha]